MNPPRVLHFSAIHLSNFYIWMEGLCVVGWWGGGGGRGVAMGSFSSSFIASML